MRVLITGAAGFLGRHFTLHHAAAEDEVVAIDDMSSPYAKWPPTPEIEAFKMDAADYLSMASERFDLVYHFAAPVGGREKIEGDPLFNADSLRLDAALFRWATVALPKVIVYPSSSAVYGWMLQRDPVPMKEVYFNPGNIDWPAPDEMYGTTKLVGEYLAYKAAKYGVNTLCIRPFSGYGEDQSLEYPMPSIIARVKAREDPLIVWGPGFQTRDFIHVDDVVGATLARIKNGVEGYHSMNIGWGEQTSFNELAALAAKLFGYEPEIVNLPDKPFGVMYRYCDPERMKTYYPKPKVRLGEGIDRMLRSG